MQIRVLGPVDVIDDDGNNKSIGGPLPHRLVAVLVAAQGRSIAVDDLTEALWPGRDRPADPISILRTHVARLRSTLGTGAIATGPGSYALGEIDTDAKRFTDLVERARRSSGSLTVVDLWRQSLDLWRGPAFGEHADLDLTRSEAARLDELKAEATEAWFDARLAAGEGRELVADLEAAATAFPLQEGLRAQQLTALARAGRSAEALRVFQEFRAELTDIGLAPSERLIELEQEIVSGRTPRVGARRHLRGYQLEDRLGEGAFAVVHRATQASVGRAVAIKQIRSQLADQPEFIRQFEAEAHLVARLEHPHIVPLYDYWREPGSAYLVMRYLNGGSLAGRILDGRRTAHEMARIVGQIAAGLDAAHRAGVIHRDVKPANILLDETGNAYLSDFGIAVEEAERLDPEAWLSHGSPAYAPPEQLNREAVGPTADVYALAVTVYESLTGALPFPGERTMAGLLARQMNDPIPLVRALVPDVPAAVDTVIQRATDKSPADRYPSAGAFALDLAAAVGLEGDAQLVQPQERNPYKGLAAFDEGDAADFAGRDRLVAEVLASIERNPAVVVVGPSGSGKSSVVRAGVLPAIRHGRLPGADRWLVTTMVPGVDPFADLEAALLRVAVDPPADVGAELRGSSKGLARMVRRLIPGEREVLLVVDQFEELFTLSTDEGVADRFLEALIEALTEEQARVHLVATLRADFYDQPLRHPEFARLIRSATVPVHPLAADELEKSITEPARSVGATFESGLVARITADVADQPGGLPLLQYALTELYEQRVDHVLTTEAYDRLGGVTGALARRAEQVLAGWPGDVQASMRRVFGRLVSLGEGTEDTRRRVIRAELGSEGSVASAIDAFGAARLLSFDRDLTTREPTVEVAHEALLREWPRLRTWIDEDRDSLRMLRHLTVTAEGWDRGARADSELYRGGRLEAAEEWAADHVDHLRPVEAEFLTASSMRRDADLERDRRTTRRLRRLLAGVAAVAVVALVAGVVAIQQRSEARESAASAETERIAAQAVALVEQNPQLALLLAAEAFHRDSGVEGLGALQTTLTGVGNFLGVLEGAGSFSHVAWLDEHRLVGAGVDGLVVIDSISGEVMLRIDEPVADRWMEPGLDGAAIPWKVAAFNRDHAAFFPASDPCCLVFANLTTGEVTSTSVEIPRDDRIAATYGANWVDVHPELPLAVTIDTSGTMRLFNMTDGSLEWSRDAYPEESLKNYSLPPDYDGTQLLPGSGVDFGEVPTFWTFRSLAFLPETEEIVTSSGPTRFWDLASGEQSREERSELWGEGSTAGPQIRRMSGISVGPRGAPVLHDSEVIVDGDRDVHVETTGSFFGLPKLVAVEELEHGRYLVQFSDRRLALVDGQDGSIIRAYPIPLDVPGRMSLSADGQRVAVPSRSGIGLWHVAGGRLIASALDRHGGSTATINTTGSEISGADAAWWFADWYETDPFRLSVATGERLAVPAAKRPEYVFSYSPAVSIFYTYGIDGSARTYDIDSLELLGDFHTIGFAGFAVSRDGTKVAMANGAGLGVFTVGGEQLALLETPVLAGSVAFNEDSSRLVAADAEGEFFHVWDTATWELIDDGSTLVRPVQAASYSPDGRYLVTLDTDGGVTLRDATDHHELKRLQGSRSAAFLNTPFGFSGDGRYLLVGGGDTIAMWDLDEGQQVGGEFPNDPGFRFGINDGPQLVTAVGEQLLVWNLNTDEWPAIACQAAGRNLTADEWEQFGPAAEPYRATCEQWPALA